MTTIFLWIIFLVFRKFSGCLYTDKDHFCPYWASQGFCKTAHVAYMTKNCQKSCFCVEGEKNAALPISDLVTRTANLGSFNVVLTFRDY